MVERCANICLLILFRMDPEFPPNKYLLTNLKSFLNSVLMWWFRNKSRAERDYWQLQDCCWLWLVQYKLNTRDQSAVTIITAGLLPHKNKWGNCATEVSKMTNAKSELISVRKSLNPSLSNQGNESLKWCQLHTIPWLGPSSVRSLITYFFPAQSG